MRENGRRNVFMTKSPRKNVPDVGIELGAVCTPSEVASNRAIAPGFDKGNAIPIAFHEPFENNRASLMLTSFMELDFFARAHVLI